VVDKGQSSQPVFSPDGGRMLFVSSQRQAHEQSQVYEMDLKSGKDRRVTFQNGAVTHARYQPKGGSIVYSSPTDELKEHPPLLNPFPKPSKLPPDYTQPDELYLHSLKNLRIRRLTHTLGFDGEAHFTPNGRTVTWTRVQNERTLIMAMDLSSRTPYRLPDLGINPTDYVISPDNKWRAWIEWDKTFGLAKIRLKRWGRRTVEIASDMIVTKRDLSFSPDSGWLLWAQKDPQTNLFNLWGYRLKNKCLNHFSFSSEGDRRDPTVSPDMKWLTYTLISRGRSKIAQVPFVQRTGPCPVLP
jgi:Tol biopolymer transport system component